MDRTIVDYVDIHGNPTSITLNRPSLIEHSAGIKWITANGTILIPYSRVMQVETLTD